ncbi:MAG: hypothetical protein HN891_10215 [Planctomycetes bacterium]|jgi:hypothetical protein|nr:hypothetical protein [Planctomycetota bacterium]MBT6452962.1 hypothetical protein [Planctomycetota bacterium]MBT6541801.1 hypothetical protein [Planctomycetota bacterium]MBT6785695.1 hypothetical protein [Planctomycetota bacterium]MBT6968198.1 hypothetical protein [Planctomycetota bacterium]
MKTLLALSIAVRNLWLLALVVMLVLVLDPGWGLYEATAEAAGGSERLLRGTLALTLVGVLGEHLLGAVTRRRQGALAKALLRLQPGLQHVGAIRILVRALETANQEIVDKVHKELIRLSGKDLGRDPGPWLQWIQRLEEISSGRTQEPETPSESAKVDGEKDG